MVKQTISDIKPKSSEPPAPEMLKPQAGQGMTISDVATATANSAKLRSKLHHTTYRPSHKATFIGIGVVVLILAVNIGVIIYLMNMSSGDSVSKDNKGEVTISSDVLDKLGVNRSNAGNLGTELTVTPNASFKGTLTVSGNTSVAGKVNINNKLSATDASLTKLTAGETALSELNVNGNTTVSNLNLRNNLIVTGTTTTQGAVTVGGLLTVGNSVNIVGNLSVGGTLSMGNFQTNTLTIGGHVLTRGSAPGYSRGSILRSTDTISLSGNDAAGTVAVNIGAGSVGAGCIISVSFVNQYTATPHVIITPVGPARDSYVARSASGFSICVASGLSYGGYAFDYIVMQ